MSNVLSMRLGKLEKLAQLGNPLALLTDEELEARIDEVNAIIEAQVGMPIAEYAEYLSKALEAGEPMPGDWTGADVRQFIASVRRTKH